MLRACLAAAMSASSLFLCLGTGCGGGGASAGNTTAPIAGTPAIAFAPSSLSFGSVAVGSTAATQTFTVTSSGSAALVLSSVAISDTTDYTFVNGCGTSLAAGATCTLTVTFAPKSANTLNASIALTDNANGAINTVQTLSIAGTGSAPTSPSAPVTSGARTLYAVPTTASDYGYGFLYALVNNAKSSIDMTMYELVDTTFSGDLVAACQRGVKVRVILDQNNEMSNNAPAFAQINAQPNCSAVYANTAFQVTHQKSILVDNSSVAIMTLNLASRYYATTRDYAVVDTDANDLAAVEATFNRDYAAGTTASGAVGASDYSYAPGPGDDLIWSPTTAQADLLGVINGATKTLDVENEEMSASNIVSALTAAAQRGVAVRIIMVNQSSYTSNFNLLKAAGCSLHLYPNTSTGYYIHAKAMVADLGLGTQSTYVGSINFSNASLTENRELGMYLYDSSLASQLDAYMASDYAGGTPY